MQFSLLKILIINKITSRPLVLPARHCEGRSNLCAGQSTNLYAFRDLAAAWLVTTLLFIPIHEWRRDCFEADCKQSASQ